MSTSLPSQTKSAFTLIEMLVVLAILALLMMLIAGGVSRSLERARAVTCMSNLRQVGTLIPQYASENNGYFPWARPAASAASGAGWNWNSYGPSLTGIRDGWSGRFHGGELPYLAGYHEGGIMTREEYNRPGSRHIFDCPVGAKSALQGDLGYSINQQLTGTVGGSFRRYSLGEIQNPQGVILIADNSRGADPNPYQDRRQPPWFTRSSSGWGSWTNTIGFHRHSNKAQMLFADLHVGTMSRDEVSLENIDVEIF